MYLLYLQLGLIANLRSGSSVEIFAYYRFGHAYREEAEVCGRRSSEAEQSSRLNSFGASIREVFFFLQLQSLLALTPCVNDFEVITMSGFLTAIRPSCQDEISCHIAKVKESLMF